jgi:hypothetical protein
VHGTLKDWTLAGLPFLVWGTLITTFLCINTKNSVCMNKYAETYFILGSLESIFAGFVEEICFRWIFFLSGIAVIKITNFLFFGWFFNLGLSRLITIHIVAPIANFFTLGGLNEILGNPSNWATAASILSANAFFRDEHKYQGLFGCVHSWFAGMFLFWITLKFGLPIAIAIHFLYDFIIDIIRYIDCMFERSCQ